MSFTYLRDIPDGPNNPSNDQPNMKINTNSTDDILAVDHVSFNTANGGTHKQSTYVNKFPPGAQVDPVSILYTNSGSASPFAEVFYRNQNGILLLSCVKAFGNVSSAGAIQNAFNMTSALFATGKYDITLTANAVSSANVTILLTVDDNGNRFASYTARSFGGGVLTFRVDIWQSDTATNQNRPFSVLVLQY